MAQTARIPRTIKPFNPFITLTTAYMLKGTPANYIHLGWTAAEMDQWENLLNQWKPLYAKYSNKKVSRTTAVIEQLYEIIQKIVALDKSNHLLDRIASSPTVTIDDMNTFRIKKGVLAAGKGSYSHTSIADTVMVSIEPLGGGDVHIQCRTNHHIGRPAIPEGADCVEFMYQIGDTAPANADAASLKKGNSTHASFTLRTGTPSRGKNLYIYFRWYNNKHPLLAGSWSELKTELIL